MDEHYPSLVDMIRMLSADALRSAAELQKQLSPDDRNYWARVHARAVFAAIEGTCECFRQQAFVAEANKIPHTVALGKLSVLAGESYFVTDEGEVRRQTLRTRFLPHVLFCLNSYAEAQGAVHRTQKGDEWHRIRAAVAARDRITHPKNLQSLEISPGEIEDIDFTFRWFWNEVATILVEKGGLDASEMSVFMGERTRT
jgi:hypothetical protein